MVVEVWEFRSALAALKGNLERQRGKFWLRCGLSTREVCFKMKTAACPNRNYDSPSHPFSAAFEVIEIAAAAVSAVDEGSETVTLAAADNSIAAGQLLRLADADGQTCAAQPKTDLTVASVSGAAVTFSTDITTGDTSAATNCVLSRSEELKEIIQITP